MKQRYVYDLYDITDEEYGEEWWNSFRCYPYLNHLTKKILRITEQYLGEFVKFNIKNGWYDVKDGKVRVLEFDVIDVNGDYKKLRVLKTVIPENISVSQKMKEHMYI